ncbi:MAG TPA: isochorismatase family protein [Acidimicrobiales bacterium]|nr:isochorismatase family protein [Acidimicrobiales bacterium]
MPDDVTAYDPQTALVVVDVQNDFADPGGSLYVRGGQEIIPAVNDEIAAARAGGATVVTTQDWHPPTTPHFTTDGGTWPVHCVRATWGAELHPELDVEADLVVRKGTGGEDGYSAFTVLDPDTGDARPTGLAGYLRERGVRRAVVVGLAADVCVKATALDAEAIGLDTTVRWDATRAVDVEPGDGDRALAELRDAGVRIVGAEP